MKRLLYCLSLFLFTSIAISSDSLSIGRYQLLSAEVKYTTDRGSVVTPTLFRLDTATGRTWYYAHASMKAGQINAWLPIEEPPDYQPTVEALRLAFFNEWFRANPEGGWCPLENPPRQMTKQEALDYRAALDARVRFTAQVLSFQEALRTNSTVPTWMATEAVPTNGPNRTRKP